MGFEVVDGVFVACGGAFGVEEFEVGLGNAEGGNVGVQGGSSSVVVVKGGLSDAVGDGVDSAYRGGGEEGGVRLAGLPGEVVEMVLVEVASGDGVVADELLSGVEWGVRINSLLASPLHRFTGLALNPSPLPYNSPPPSLT